MSLSLRRSLAGTMAAAAVLAALVVPSTAAVANVDGGGGGAPFTITTARFTAYGCTLYDTRWNGGQAGRISHYACSGGVRVTTPGYRNFYPGNACVGHDNTGWSWSSQACWNGGAR